LPDATEGEGDADGDGHPNFIDTDSDGDSIDDQTEGSGDPDGDGQPSDLDTDSDNDGLLDTDELAAGTKPTVADSDGDGVIDGKDAFPNDPNETADADGDGIGDNADTDCPTGFTSCAGLCIDPNTDETYCGASADCQGTNAGTTCAAGEICNGYGTCALECQVGLIECNGTCVNISNDTDHCGECDQTCLAGETCSNGASQQSCFNECNQGAVECSGDGVRSCGNFDDDPCMEWGATVSCAAGETCSNGTCE
jgi:hypothetical protein